VSETAGFRSYRVAADPGVRVRVANLGLACCAMEVESAVRLGLLVDDTTEPVDRSVLVVSGTLTLPLVPALVSAVEEAGPGASVLAFGVCASTGGPYWDAPTVVNGIDTVVPVSRYVPGCPPRPHDLVDALLAREVSA
jgi:NADH-quinone oxidoreductase subunit B